MMRSAQLRSRCAIDGGGRMSRRSLRDEIAPKNILMIGPTGVGKTEIARRLARLAQAPFVKVEASRYTEVGYVGRDVESMIRDLAECCGQDGARRSARRRRGQGARECRGAPARILFPGADQSSPSRGNHAGGEYRGSTTTRTRTRARSCASCCAAAISTIAKSRSKSARTRCRISRSSRRRAWRRWAST